MPHWEKLLPGCVRVGVLLLAGTVFCPAQTKDNESHGFTVRITTEMIEVSAATCDALIAEPRTSVDDTALRTKLRELTAKGEAVLLDIASVTTRPGLPANSESIREDIYPTEYDPYEVPIQVPDQVLNAAPLQPSTFRTPFSPSAFETRNIGTTLEATPVTQDNGKTYQVTFGLAWIGRHADAVFAKWKDAAVETDMGMPTFYAMELKGHASLRAGLPTQVGILSPKGPDGAPDPSRKVLVFLRAETLEVKP